MLSKTYCIDMEERISCTIWCSPWVYLHNKFKPVHQLLQPKTEWKECTILTSSDFVKDQIHLHRYDLTIHTSISSFNSEGRWSLIFIFLSHFQRHQLKYTCFILLFLFDNNVMYCRNLNFYKLHTLASTPYISCIAKKIPIQMGTQLKMNNGTIN